MTGTEWPGCLQAALHPTPAVCGRPRATAKDILASQEPFDRGFYSGPFGWLSGSAAEFVVAIRSALIHPAEAISSSTQHSTQLICNANENGNGSATHITASPVGEATPHMAGLQSRDRRSRADVQGTISLFAGVGIVKGSTAEAEWQVHSFPHSGLSLYPSCVAKCAQIDIVHYPFFVGCESVISTTDLKSIANECCWGEVHVASEMILLRLRKLMITRDSAVMCPSQELELKTRQFQLLLQPVVPLSASPNVNLLCARAMVEELCRLGVNAFAIAPGSSP